MSDENHSPQVTLSEEEEKILSTISWRGILTGVLIAVQHYFPKGKQKNNEKRQDAARRIKRARREGQGGSFLGPLPISKD